MQIKLIFTRRVLPSLALKVKKQRKEKRSEKEADLKKGKFSLYLNLVFKDTKFRQEPRCLSSFS